MADFRVAEHHRWRETAARGSDRAARPSAARAAEEGWVPIEVDLEPESSGPPGGAFSGIVQLPARLHDLLFRPLRGHRRLFLSARFLLVLIAVLLILQGVAGSADVRVETGEYRSVTNPATVQTYLSPGSTHKYPIDVALGPDGRISALFTNDRGVVRLPAAAQDGSAYGLQIGVTKSHPAMEVRLLVAQPGESYRNAPVVRDDRDLIVFDAGAIGEPGEYGLLVRSAQGVGPAKLSITIVEAPVERIGAERLEWLPLISGAALATVLVGPYLPGAHAGREDDRARTRSPLASQVIVVGPASSRRRSRRINAR